MAAYIECDACGCQMAGYTQKELQAEGWTWTAYKGDHPANPKHFIMCSDCTVEYEKRRELRKLVAA